MTPRPTNPDELLSACHDGELSPAERAEVDRLLAESPALQETLDDFHELTAILQSIPRPAAPAQLQSSVLKRVQAARPTQPTRRRPWMWGLSILASAAVLLLMVWVQGPLGLRPGAVDVAAGRAPPESASLKQQEDVVATAAPAVENRALTAENPATADAVVEDRAARPAARPIAADSPVAGVAAGAAAGAPVTGEGPARVSAVPAGGAGAMAAEKLADRLVFNPNSPPEASDVLAYVDRVGKETLIVEFDVVDVDRTTSDMLILLQRRGVTVVGATIGGQASATTRVPTEADGELVALYVEAPEAHLAAVLDDVMSQVAITEGAAYNEFAAGPLVNSKVELLEQRYGDVTVRARPAAAEVPPAPAPATVAAQSLAAAAPVREEAAPPAPLASNADEDDLPPQGVRFNLPADRYEQLEARAVEDDADSARRMQRQRPAPAVAAPQLPAEKVERPMDGESFRRVLFVLHSGTNN
jgi:hypothetical protein